MTKRKTQILDVAEELFAKHGYDGTTTRLISESANANIAMISYYFGGKEKLLKAILDRFAEDLSRLINKIQEEENDPQVRLKSWVVSYLDYVFDHPDSIIIAHRQLNQITDRPEIFSSTKEAFDRIFQQIFQTLEEGQKQGDFKQLDTLLTIITLKATIEDLILESKTIKKDFDIEDDGQNKLYPESFKNRVKDHMISLLEIYIFKAPTS
ncbi:MAG: TetR family transcriptional regulator [Balneolales bacterium]